MAKPPGDEYWDQYETYGDPADTYWDQYEDAPEEDSGWGDFGSGYGLPSLSDIGLTAIKAPFEAQKGLMGLGDFITTPMRALSEQIGSYFGYDEPIPGIRESVRNLGYDPQNVLNRLGEQFDSPELKAARREVEQAKGWGETAKSLWRNPGLIGLDIEASAPSIALGGALGAGAKTLGAASRFAGPIGEGLLTAGQHAGGVFDEKGSFDIEDVPYTAASGLATGLISAGGNRIAKALGLPDIDEMLANGDLQGIKKVKALLGGGTIEGLFEEGPQSASEQTISNLATGKPWSEGVPGATISGTMSGFALGSMGPAMGRAKPSMSDNYTQQELPFGPPEPTQQTLIQHPIDRYHELMEKYSGDSLLSNEDMQELIELEKQLGVNKQVTKPIRPGINPRTGKFRKIYPQATTQGQLPLEPPGDESGQFELDLGLPGGPRAKPAPTLRSPLEAIGDEEGSADFMQVWDTLKKLLGRDPSVAEIEAEMQKQDNAALQFTPRESTEELPPGTPTGAVAPFVDPIVRQFRERFPGITDEQIAGIRDLQAQIQAARAQTPIDWRTVNNLEGELGRRFGEALPPHPADNEPPEILSDEELGIPPRPSNMNMTPPSPVPPPMNQPGPSVPPADLNLSLPVPPAGPTGIVPPSGPPPPGQRNLPFWGMGGEPPTPPPSDVFDEATAREIVDRAFPPPGPEQQSMIPEFMDEEMRQWWREQDRIIGENQAQRGPIMGPSPDDDDVPRFQREPPPRPSQNALRAQIRQLEEAIQYGKVRGPEYHQQLQDLRRQLTELYASEGPTEEELSGDWEALPDSEQPPKVDPAKLQAFLNQVQAMLPAQDTPGRRMASEAIEGVQGRDAAIEELIRRNLGAPPITAPSPDEDFMNQVMGAGIAHANKPRTTQGQLPFAPGELERYMEAMNPVQSDPSKALVKRRNRSADEIGDWEWDSHGSLKQKGLVPQDVVEGEMFPRPAEPEPTGMRKYSPVKKMGDDDYTRAKREVYRAYQNGEIVDLVEALEYLDETFGVIGDADISYDDDVQYQRAKPSKSTKAGARAELGEIIKRRMIDKINENIDARRDPMEGVNEIAQLMPTDKSAFKAGWDKLSHEGKRLVSEAMHMERTTEEDEDVPRFAKVEGGGLTASANLNRMVVNITKDYTSPLPGIMVREATQNALDAVKDMGAAGKVVVRQDLSQPKYIEVYDNGSGMDEQTLATKLAELFASGKEGEEGAAGGKGIGSASYIYGGKHFTVETVAVDKNDVTVEDPDGTTRVVRKATGKKYKITASGTPIQFLDKIKGSDWESVEVPMSTPTYTRVKTILKDDQTVGHSSNMMTSIGEFSRDKDTQIIFDSNDFSLGIPISEVDENSSRGNYIKRLTIPSTKDDKVIGELDFKDSDITISLAPFDPTKKNSSVEIHYLNNGMYQFTDYKSFEEAKGIPPNIIINVKPRIDEQDDNYPFINTREDVKKDMRDYVNDYIDRHITSPAISKKKNRTQELYDSMPHVPIPGAKRKTVIFDPGERLTPDELDYLVNDPIVHDLIRHWDRTVERILQSIGRTEWSDRLEGIGLVLDPGMNGVHIPNPATKKSTILINPFLRAEIGVSATDNAFRNTITLLHEVAHIGSEYGAATQPVPASYDMSDPRYAKFYMSLMEQIQEHGDVYTRTGHGVDFVHRLGEVYAKFGPARTFAAVDKIQSIFTGGPQYTDYSPEFQRLLYIHTTSRGRPETTEDLLSGTGVKQSDPRHGGKSNVPGDTGLPREGATPRSVTETVIDETTRLIKDDTGAMPIPSWNTIKQKTGWGQGKSKPAGHGPKYNALHETIMLPAGATTTLDLSAPGRQGLALIHTPQYWKALLQMPRGLLYSEFDKIDKQLRAKPIFQPIWNPVTKRYEKSVAERAGLQLMVPASSIAPGVRAQQIASKWLETGGFLGPEYIKGVKNPARAAYFHTIGYPVRATNRAFITFLNSLRANRFEYLMNRAQEMSDRGARTGRTRMPGVLGGINLPGGGNIGLTQAVTRQEAANMDPYLNHELAKEIADFVNTATGAAPLKTHILPFRQAELNLERGATLLSAVFFSPGLMASRIRMLNPNTYVMASPAVRKEYMKSALATTVAWYAFTHMIKMAAEGLDLEDEVEISDKITSADFGKVRIGDTRLDVGGGFQQFIVNYARVWHGGWTSSANQEFHNFGEGYRAETQRSNIERFLTNKMNPVVKFAYDLADADQYAPFHVYDRMAQLAVPLYIQDIIEIAKENPQLFPLAAPIALLGGGTQMYGKGESVGKLIDPENEWLSEGAGGIRSLMPWNIGEDEYEMTDFPWQNPEDQWDNYEGE